MPILSAGPFRSALSSSFLILQNGSFPYSPIEVLTAWPLAEGNVLEVDGEILPDTG
jgi:hypothetical protein